MTTWYAIVGFGPCIHTRKTFKAREEAESYRQQLSLKDQSGWTGANSRVYGYTTRKQARAADISDHLRGRSGRIV